MKTYLNFGAAFLAAVFFTACESMYHISTTNIEVLVPANVVFPAGYNRLAIRDNNINIAYNPKFEEYLVDGSILQDTANLDSIASKIYFEHFLTRLRSNPLFEQITEIQQGDYSNIQLSDSIISRSNLNTNDSMYLEIPLAIEQLGKLAPYLDTDTLSESPKKFIDPVFGLYTADELTDIADTTDADMLLSLDFFTVLYAQGNTGTHTAWRNVFVTTSWNFYDLKIQELPYFYHRTDTIFWQYSLDGPKLPKREQALEIASEIAGNVFADFLVPNWINVERVYYRPWNKEVKATRKLIADGAWKEAAAYWKPYTNDKIKRIAARGMFNMALAAEMENQIDAAIDWAVRSYHLYGNKDEFHKEICEDYIRILSQRKQDIRLIDIQFTREINETK